ncbi:uncharacterized protein ARMOST_00810 [Armillaria ostoyae]|uniref:Uncharacterized protein n=1 Tax=Armillaria ostoyae TaxID=47428 RepID=A0A284QM94_ARMOS|nr:uncharacterized protein ARMOST_00810 [Armillaria ostoyae]
MAENGRKESVQLEDSSYPLCTCARWKETGGSYWNLDSPHGGAEKGFIHCASGTGS